MIHFNSEFGRYVKRRLRRDQIIWLTTVDARNSPQPRPVWFHWDGHTVLLFSEEDRAKIRHIAGNPRVALNFNTNEEGGDVAVLLGEARILDKPPPPSRMSKYVKKYSEGIESLQMTVAQFKDAYDVPIVITPQAIRGFVD
ncbi:MAG: TIGR03667 family PPOX class F420-dependent oxidoreductase [Deltaproteobacteria bacterium]|nr:TIGR03667 family PPOX class F420-dependent oxidoreductase [Deltaproteobacteria bacterium]